MYSVDKADRMVFQNFYYLSAMYYIYIHNPLLLIIEMNVCNLFHVHLLEKLSMSSNICTICTISKCKAISKHH